MPSSIDLIIEAKWIIPVEPANLVLENHSIAIDRGRIVAILQQSEAKSQFTPKEIKKIFPKIKTTITFYLDEDTNFSILINEIIKYIDSNIIDYILLDSKIGGSGKTHNWELSSKIVQKQFPFPIILAGGLNPDNIKNAVAKVKPFGVDVMSGVNKSNSKCKDMNKISHFVKNINN